MLKSGTQLGRSKISRRLPGGGVQWAEGRRTTQRLWGRLVLCVPEELGGSWGGWSHEH